MKNTPDNLPKRYQDAVNSSDLRQLETLILTDSLENLSFGDKEKLAQVFFMHGEEFRRDSDNPEAIEHSISAFEKAIRLDPSFSKARLSNAQAHLKLGIMKHDHNKVSRANELFSQADTLLRAQGQKLPLEILWDWGISLYFIAKDSEEAIDYKLTLDKFREAYSRGFQNPDFLLDFGTTLGEFGVIIGKGELIQEAVQYLEISLKERADNPSAWLRMACAYKMLYFMTGDVGYFEKADHSFLAAARLDDSEAILWYNWGQLLSMEGKIVRDESLLKSAEEKLQKAIQMSSQMRNKGRSNSLMQITLADTLIHLGALEDNIELFHEAKRQLETVINVAPDHQEAICLSGLCEIHIGKYFSDPDILHLAIEKFQKGIGKFRNNSALWHGLATAHYALAELKEDVSEYEKASKFCSQAIKLNHNNPSYWNDWGVALMKLGDLTSDRAAIAASVEKFEEAIRSHHRKHKGNPDPDWIYNYGCALDFLGEFEQNPHHYERAIAVLMHLHAQYPQSTHIRYNLAIALYHLGDATGEEEALERAIEHFEFLAKLDGEDDNVLNDLGLVCLTLGDVYRDSFNHINFQHHLTQAEHYFTQSLAAGGTESNYWLGCLYTLQGNYADAMHFLERAKVSGVLPHVDEILTCEWLDDLKNTARFKAFLGELTEEN